MSPAPAPLQIIVMNDYIVTELSFIINGRIPLFCMYTWVLSGQGLETSVKEPLFVNKTYTQYFLKIDYNIYIYIYIINKYIYI